MNKNKKIIITVVGIIVVAIIVFAIVKIFSEKNKTETSTSTGTYNANNETISDAYNSKDVAYSFIKDISKNGNTGTHSVDIVFSDDGYKTTIYCKMIVNYAEMDDEIMLSLLKERDPYGGSKMSPNYEKFNVNGTTKLETSDLGQDTTITRNGNTVTYTYYTTNYNSLKKLTPSDKEELKQSFLDDGYTLK